ncbi:hypothetical protein [Aquimarina algicola]|uniref:Uncharacterized protein n=1 Tax=Aquimarina algicola TaxID=2589995 RepID=A0A504J450_9FLAO|nr:hypothetical protein [Aquimarina algicola]TPN85234.1 hypothetical protein FHK87_14495 [Aquimarina algicola]
MPIKSYLAHPYEGKKETLIKALTVIDQCEILPAENENLIVLVTETETEKEEEMLKEKLDAIKSLKLLAMVSGFNTPQKNN